MKKSDTYVHKKRMNPNIYNSFFHLQKLIIEIIELPRIAKTVKYPYFHSSGGVF
jgi:hypothetical protein